MITKLKKVYYCEYCKKKKGMSAGSMGLHEKHCTANIDRECRLCVLADNKQKDYKDIYKRFFKGKVLGQKLYDTLTDELGCPACVLTVLRMRELPPPEDRNLGITLYNFRDEFDKFMAEMNKKAEEEDGREAMYG